jgi:2-oxo-3-hexenedioate decarboxylase
VDVDGIAQRLLHSLDSGPVCDPVSDQEPGFSVSDAYAVLAAIGRRREKDGWRQVGRKIGFTNRTLWEAYGVDRAFWANVWDRTLVPASDGAASVDLGSFTQPRIEAEVVFGLRGPVPSTDDPVAVLAAVDWMAPGFEVAQCPYRDWRFGIADCIAAAGFHGALVVGTPVRVDDASRDAIAATLARFEATLWRDGDVVDSGSGANVMGSPALALGHLAHVLAEQPGAPALGSGELVTTGSLADAHFVHPGEQWRAGYGELGLEPFTLTFT